MNQKFNPNNISRLVFDLNSLHSISSEEGWSNFQAMVKIFDDRSYSTVLISQTVRVQDWQSHENVQVLHGTSLEMLEKNTNLDEPQVFWITDDSDIQSELHRRHRPFGGGTEETLKHQGMQFQNLQDLLEVFHPSRNTSQEIAETVEKLKEDSPRMPLTIGIGGPEGCGHPFFVGELVEVLESRNLLVAGLDLTELLGVEFSRQEDHLKYWRSEWIYDWTIKHVLNPFSRGEQVLIEDTPDPLSGYEVTPFPFYLVPEMVLLVWGSTLFLEQFSELIDIRILLELSPSAATARAFNIDEREDFDPSFIESYQSSEGSAYNKYLEDCKVYQSLDYLIDFDNFHAFRMKEKQKA